MKTIKVKLEQILNAVPSLKKLVSRDVTMATGNALRKLVKRLNDEVGIFEAQRLDLYKAHGVEDGGQYILKTDEAKEAVGNGLKALLEVEVEIEFRPVKLSGFVGTVNAAEFLPPVDLFLDDDLDQ